LLGRQKSGTSLNTAIRRYWATPHYLARGSPLPPYGKHRIVHPRMVVALCVRSVHERHYFGTTLLTPEWR
jgi:hypothetical protein